MSYAGLEALAGEVPPLPAKASSPALVVSFIIHYPLSIIHYPLIYGIQFADYKLSRSLLRTIIHFSI
jgi:hypothetical protein